MPGAHRCQGPSLYIWEGKLMQYSLHNTACQWTFLQRFVTCQTLGLETFALQRKCPRNKKNTFPIQVTYNVSLRTHLWGIVYVQNIWQPLLYYQGNHCIIILTWNVLPVYLIYHIFESTVVIMSYCIMWFTGWCHRGSCTSFTVDVIGLSERHSALIYNRKISICFLFYKLNVIWHISV